MRIIEISNHECNRILEKTSNSITIDFEEFHEDEICLKCDKIQLHCKVVDVKYSPRHTLIKFVNHLVML